MCTGIPTIPIGRRLAVLWVKPGDPSERLRIEAGPPVLWVLERRGSRGRWFEVERDDCVSMGAAAHLARALGFCPRAQSAAAWTPDAEALRAEAETWQARALEAEAECLRLLTRIAALERLQAAGGPDRV